MSEGSAREQHLTGIRDVTTVTLRVHGDKLRSSLVSSPFFRFFTSREASTVSTTPYLRLGGPGMVGIIQLGDSGLRRRTQNQQSTGWDSEGTAARG